MRLPAVVRTESRWPKWGPIGLNTRISPADGRVLGWIDMTGLLTEEERAQADVLNGIAYDQAGNRMIIFAGKTLKPFHDWALQCDLGSKQTDRLPSNMPTNMKMAIVAAVNIVVILVVCSLFTSAQKTQKARTIDVGRSTITIQVFKAGLFSAFGHDHEISAPIQQGAFSEENPSVELSVDARKLRVVDKDVSDKDRAEIQQTMLGPKVLDSERFPQIRFRSTQVESAGTGKWIVPSSSISNVAEIVLMALL